jgi:AcrR family transcriptional regulator
VRITAEAKEATRRKILSASYELFRTVGFEGTTTRDIAKAANIATGTLFNYFPTKEAIVTCLVMEARPTAAPIDSENHETLEEALFAHAAHSLRLLKPYRKFLLPLLETIWSPLMKTVPDDDGEALRTAHLERVEQLARAFVEAGRLTPIACQMYWTLYLGVLAHWINDKSPKQEDTLALLDHSTAMFVGWLQGD